MDTLDRLLSDNLSYGHSNGATDTKLELLQRIRQQNLRYADLHVSSLTVTRSTGGFAVITGRMVAKVVVDGTARLIESSYLAVWASEARALATEWRLLAYQGTPIQR